MAPMRKQTFPIDSVRKSIRRMMEETGEKPKPLAAKLGLSVTGIRDIFLAKTKSVGGPKLSAIANYFGVSVEDIMSGSATTNNEPDEREGGIIISVPLQLPSERILTEMFEILLKTAGITDDQAQYSQVLSEHFPAVFRTALQAQGRGMRTQDSIEIALDAVSPSGQKPKR